MIKIVVTGTPVPQGSGFAVSKHGQVFNPRDKRVAPWREAVRAETQRAVEVPLSGAVEARIVFLLSRPKSHYRTGRNAHLLRDGAPAFPEGKPDLDKLARAVLDGLTEGRAFWDDSQVCALSAAKIYAVEPRKPGAEIELEEL